MVCNEAIKVNVNSYSEIPDALGQIKKTITESREIEMYIKVFTQINVNDPRYIDADYIGLTEDKMITENNTISFGGKTYNVVQLVPTRRYTKVLLKKWK